ncbi:DUF4129 domain-containing protein [Roseivirga sp. E12]|uniref:DUF4129 domain-containing protein n=1 Tax=Roseivirga sp. E12 TaxID=2819237 RepID=UPI001ABD0E78|nr:DUF4129 domain-containing protein [Roseivirga sp. E12]MBO3699483.1 DUF4129 domain-containing protein [Roseivirga sp. E12]
MRIISVILLSLFTFFSTSAQQTDSTGTQIEIREFDQEKLSEYQQDKNFQYELPKPEREGILERIWRWLQEWYASVIGTGPTANIIDILFRIGLFAAFVFFIIKIFGIEVTTVFKPTKAQKLPYQVSEEQLLGIDFEQEIANAIQQKQWRFAVRLTYLHALKLLAEAEWLTVKKGKTNRDYLYELSGKNIEKDFERLSFIFDYTWYGHFEASDVILEEAKDHFDKIQNAKTIG